MASAAPRNGNSAASLEIKVFGARDVAGNNSTPA